MEHLELFLVVRFLAGAVCFNSKLLITSWLYGTISVTLESSKLVGVMSPSAALKLSSSNTSEISSSSEKSLAILQRK